MHVLYTYMHILYTLILMRILYYVIAGMEG